MVIFFFKLQHNLLSTEIQNRYTEILTPIQQSITTRRGPAPSHQCLRTEHDHKLISNYQELVSIIKDCPSITRLKTKLKLINSSS